MSFTSGVSRAGGWCFVSPAHSEWSKWHAVESIAKKSMASLCIDGQPSGMGVFVGPNVLLIPRHVIADRLQIVCGRALNDLLKRVQVRYSTDCRCHCSEVVLLEDGGSRDYCLLKLKSSINHGALVFKMGEHNGECLFTQIQGHDTFRSEPVTACLNDPQLMCGRTRNWTQPGSCGGIFLDASGQMIALHLGQSNGQCDSQTGEERYVLFAKEFMRHSTYMSTLDQAYRPIQRPICLTPSPLAICYTPQADVGVTVGDRKGNACHGSEIHITQSERGVRIKIDLMILDEKSKKLKKHSQTVSYQLFLLDSDDHLIRNIHNSKKNWSSYTKETAQSFYQGIVNLFFYNSNYRNMPPDQFDFEFKKCQFVARKIENFQ